MTAAVQVDQSQLTVYAELVPGGYESMRDLFAPSMGTSALFPFASFPNVHFGRVVLMPPATDLSNQPIAAALIFIVDFDGPVAAFITAVTTTAAVQLDQMFAECAGYPGSSRADFLVSKSIKNNTVYVNWTGRSVAQILQEADLRDRIETIVDQIRPALASQSPMAIRTAIQQQVKTDPALSWVTGPVLPRTLAWDIRRGLEIGLTVVALLLLLPWLLLGLIPFAIVLRWHETTDVPDAIHPDLASLEKLADLEDQVVQNPFSALGLVKPGLFRRYLLMTVLFGLNVSARFIFNRGRLSGVGTIHFARWVMTDNNRRLLFCSNYDGSLESYMDDFIDKVAWGLNAAFSNGQGYPRTNWLIRDGAYDEQSFKNFLHNHQLPTPVWYSAYPTLTNLNIINNASVRAGLFGEMTDSQAREWLALL